MRRVAIVHDWLTVYAGAERVLEQMLVMYPQALNYLPKSVQPKAKKDLQEIWMAPGRKEAERAFDHFVHVYGAKYPRAVKCLVKDRESLLTFYDFPAEHWVHIRTTNPIESTFATVRHRSDQAKGCVSHLAKVIEGVKFKDGMEMNDNTGDARAVADHDSYTRFDYSSAILVE